MRKESPTPTPTPTHPWSCSNQTVSSRRSMRIGLTSFDEMAKTEEEFAKLGNTFLLQRSQELSTQLQVFQGALVNYAKEHGQEIAHNPTFRSEFSKICHSFGVDPLFLTSSQDPKSFYYELSIRIIKLCNETRDLNGGMISLGECCKMLSNASEKDVLKSLEILKPLGDEISLVGIGSHSYIKSVPHHLNQDQSLVLDTCNILRSVSISLLRANFKWTALRSKTVLDEMVSCGLLWVDNQDEEKQFWMITLQDGVDLQS